MFTYCPLPLSTAYCLLLITARRPQTTANYYMLTVYCPLYFCPLPTVHCPQSTAHCLLPTLLFAARCPMVITTARVPLSIVYDPVTNVFCPLFTTAHCPVSTTHSLLTIVYCPLYTAQCLISAPTVHYTYGICVH
jgi:hypothetical protein